MYQPENQGHSSASFSQQYRGRGHAGSASAAGDPPAVATVRPVVAEGEGASGASALDPAVVSETEARLEGAPGRGSNLANLKPS